MLAVRPDGAPPPGDACQCHRVVPASLADQDVSRLAHLYLCERLSTYRIGQLTGLDRQHITRRLRRECRCAAAARAGHAPTGAAMTRQAWPGRSPNCMSTAA